MRPRPALDDIGEPLLDPQEERPRQDEGEPGLGLADFGQAFLVEGPADPAHEGDREEATQRRREGEQDEERDRRGEARSLGCRGCWKRLPRHNGQCPPPCPGRARYRRPRVHAAGGRRLSTNAKKVTVSVLYWYEKLPVRKNGTIFGTKRGPLSSSTCLSFQNTNSSEP